MGRRLGARRTGTGERRVVQQTYGCNEVWDKRRVDITGTGKKHKRDTVNMMRGMNKRTGGT